MVVVVVIVWYLNLQLLMQSVPITTESRSCEVYSIQHYVIKFVNDLRQVGGFPRVLRLKEIKGRMDKLMCVFGYGV
jgi:hypothetical protein